jgi:hypothetical protein
MVNIFINEEDKILAAQSMCDQHVCKLPWEVAKAAWDAIRKIHYALYEQARIQGIKKNELAELLPHQHLHPLSRWMALCAANLNDALLRGKAIAKEYTFRFGKPHGALPELLWLLDRTIYFHTPEWRAWLTMEMKGVDSKGKKYADWFASYGYYQEMEPKVFVWDQSILDRLTHHPQIMDEDDYPGCRTLHDPVTAARKYYILKAGGTIDGKMAKHPMKQLMRYCYRPPPLWLVESGVVLQTEKKKRTSSSIQKKIKK